MNKNKEKFIEILRDNTYGIFPAPTSAELALEVICDYLLGEDWYVNMAISQEQVNTCIVDNILRKYSREYKKDLKKAQRNYEWS